jgi:hypothetical protein
MNINLLTRRALLLSVLLFLLPGCKQTFDSSLITMELEDNNTSLHRYENLDGMIFKKIGGNGYDWGPIMFPKGDHFLLAGSTYGTFRNSTDFIISKVDQFSVLESYVFGGNQQDLLEDAIALKDGGVALFGQSKSFFFTFLGTPAPERPLVIKLDAALNIEFAREYKPFLLKFDCLYESQTEELIFGGSLFPFESKQKGESKESKITPSILVKTDKEGEPVSAVRFEVGNDSQAKKILNDDSNHYMVFGDVFDTKIASENASYVAKFDQDFNAKEAYLFHTPSFNFQIMDVTRFGDDYVALASYFRVLRMDAHKIQRDSRIVLMLLNKDLQMEWAYEYKFDESALAFQVFDDQRGNIVLSGLVGDEEKFATNALVLFVNSKGILKNAAIIDTQTRDLFGGTFLTTPTGSYISYGSTVAKEKNSDFLILKYTTPTHFRDQEQGKITVNPIKISQTALTLSSEKFKISSRRIPKEKVSYPIVAK